jgi:acyl-coenzyme A synthetase/AMP-(fatty) acid ligase
VRVTPKPTTTRGRARPLVAMLVLDDRIPLHGLTQSEVEDWLDAVAAEERGVRDDDGRLTLTGWIKELTNRAGEKVSPTEIDDVLLAHPSVAEAATVGVPHPKYGEALQAAATRSFLGFRADLRLALTLPR